MIFLGVYLALAGYFVFEGMRAAALIATEKTWSPIASIIWIFVFMIFMAIIEAIAYFWKENN